MKGKESARKIQVVYLSHGGGPLPILGDPGHAAMVAFMRALPENLRKPDAILVVSAHWEENQPTVMGAANPPMLYDYYGFPEAAYAINYPAPGSPQTAARVAQMLSESGFQARVDPTRGFDHGHFIPLKMMYPEADIPTLQLSLLHSLDAAAHLALGRALRGLWPENMLVVGSGFSYHNLNAFFHTRGAPDPANDAFQDWLLATCTGELPETEREQRLVEWENAPNARYCHPRAEHLLPLHVCQGLAGEAGKVVFDDRIMGKRALAFLWD